MLFWYATCQNCTWGGQPPTCTNWPIFYYLEKKQNHFKIVKSAMIFLYLPQLFNHYLSFIFQIGRVNVGRPNSHYALLKSIVHLFLSLSVGGLSVHLCLHYTTLIKLLEQPFHWETLKLSLSLILKAKMQFQTWNSFTTCHGWWMPWYDQSLSCWLSRICEQQGHADRGPWTRLDHNRLGYVHRHWTCGSCQDDQETNWRHPDHCQCWHGCSGAGRVSWCRIHWGRWDDKQGIVQVSSCPQGTCSHWRRGKRQFAWRQWQYIHRFVNWVLTMTVQMFLPK